MKRIVLSSIKCKESFLNWKKKLTLYFNELSVSRKKILIREKIRNRIKTKKFIFFSSKKMILLLIFIKYYKNEELHGCAHIVILKRTFTFGNYTLYNEWSDLKVISNRTLINLDLSNKYQIFQSLGFHLKFVKLLNLIEWSLLCEPCTGRSIECLYFKYKNLKIPESLQVLLKNYSTK